MSTTSDRGLMGLWLGAVAVGLFALFVQFAANVYLITYEDHYTAALGPFWSLRSMTLDQKVAFIVGMFIAPLFLLCAAGMLALAIKRTFGRR